MTRDESRWVDSSCLNLVPTYTKGAKRCRPVSPSYRLAFRKAVMKDKHLKKPEQLIVAQKILEEAKPEGQRSGKRMRLRSSVGKHNSRKLQQLYDIVC
eukprot:2211701-Lingulodinium_polyedra.AAC.1